MQSTLKRESKVPEIVLGEAFRGVTMGAAFHRTCWRARGCRGAFEYPIPFRTRWSVRAFR
jgi:hypothetical protein